MNFLEKLNQAIKENASAIVRPEDVEIVKSKLAIENIAKQYLPKRLDIQYHLFNYAIANVSTPINIKAKDIIIPLMTLKHTQLYENCPRVYPLFLCNMYRILVLQHIKKSLNCNYNSLAKDIELTTKIAGNFTDGPGFIKFIENLKNRMSLLYFYALMDSLNINIVLFNSNELIFYNKTKKLDYPVAVFKYITNFDIEFINVFESFAVYNPQCYETLLSNLHI